MLKAQVYNLRTRSELGEGYQPSEDRVLNLRYLYSSRRKMLAFTNGAISQHDAIQVVASLIVLKLRIDL